MKIISVEFLGPLRVEADDGDVNWRLLADFPVRIHASSAFGDKSYDETVPEGFITDLASVPRLPGMFWLFSGKARRASVLHDYMYSGQGTDRALADAVFFRAMATDENWFTRTAMWLGVRVAGWAYWKDRPIPVAPSEPEPGVIITSDDPSCSTHSGSDSPASV